MDGFQARLKEVLALRGWTPARWAGEAELSSDSYVSNWIRRGVKNPDRDAVRKLAASAGVRFEWLFEGKGQRDPRPREDAGVTAPQRCASESTLRAVFGLLWQSARSTSATCGMRSQRATR